VAIVGRNGRLLSSRLRSLPSAVDATVATVSAATARAAATGTPGSRWARPALSTSGPLLEIRIDGQQAGRLTWEIVVHEEVAGSVNAATRYHVVAIETPVMPLSDLRPTVSGATAAGFTDENGNLTVPVIAAGALLSTNDVPVLAERLR
jgi:hypothetical protein